MQNGLFWRSTENAPKTATGSSTKRVETGTENYLAVTDTADGTILANRACMIDGSGNLVFATLNTERFKGLNKNGATVAATAAVLLATGGIATAVAATPILEGEQLKVGENGKMIPLLTTAKVGETMKAFAGADHGTQFTNQPANDSVTFASDNAADTGKVVVIYGTTNGTDTVVVETTATNAANGTTPVATTKVDWGKILAVEVTGHAGTVTFTETSGGLTITSLATGTSSKGKYAVTAANQRAYGAIPTINAGGASTDQVGLIGEDTVNGTTAYDSQALNGATVTPVNSAFNIVTYMLMGDVADATAVTLKTRASADPVEYRIGKALAAAASKNSSFLMDF